jgi:ribosome-associated heat shock protein Hsp15
MESAPEVRIDKWLWAVRLYKTRTLAAQACRGGHVSIGGENVKPSRNVRLEEVVSAQIGPLRRTVKVVGLVERRIGPKLVDDFLEDQTPASEYLRVAKAREQPLAPVRPKGSGRPTKKERRDIEKLF